MNTKLVLIAALLAGAFAPALASAAIGADATEKPSLALRFETVESGEADTAGGPQEIKRERFIINGADAHMAQAFEHANFGGNLMLMHGKPVKNAPYSAEVISEQVQSLADGNQIVNKTSSMSYRDSAGSTRQESRNASGAVSRVTIRNADGAMWILNPESRTATRIGAPREIARMAADKARIAIDKARAAGDQARIQIEETGKEGGPHEEIIVRRVERSDAAGTAARVRENVRVHVMKDMADGRPMAGLERLGPMMAGAFGDMKWSGKAVSKDLGTKEIDGVKATGKMRSYEIPAGEIGNRNAIVVSNETWYSPELQVTLLSKRSDPRVGDRTYRLAGLKRDEPAAALFTVPSDYTVKDVMAIRKSIDEKK